jgi:hypothetical protein
MLAKYNQIVGGMPRIRWIEPGYCLPESEPGTRGYLAKKKT